MTTTTDIRIAPTHQAAPADSEAAGRLVRHLERHRRSVALGLLVSAQFVVMLDTSIVNVALPSMQADLGLSSTGVTWVVNAYVLAFGGLLLLSGRAADLLGRRRMFIAGSMLFTLGTLLAAAADNPGLLVAGRLVQGAGAAGTQPCRHVTPPAELPRSAASHGHERLGRRLNSGWSDRRVGRGSACRLLRLVIGLPRHRADLGRRGRPGRAGTPGRTRRPAPPPGHAGRGSHHWGRHHACLWSRRRCRPRLDLSDGHDQLRHGCPAHRGLRGR